jgi:hypothetical protein
MVNLYLSHSVHSLFAQRLLSTARVLQCMNTVICMYVRQEVLLWEREPHLHSHSRGGQREAAAQHDGGGAAAAGGRHHRVRHRCQRGDNLRKRPHSG